MKRILFVILNIITVAFVYGQGIDDFEQNGFGQRNTFNPNALSDSTKSDHKEAPRGMYVWTVDPLFGEVSRVDRDTIQYNFMNRCFTTGMFGEYNTTGNLGAPRINRIFTDRKTLEDFFFTQPLDYFITEKSNHRFTNTLSPITNVTFFSCGDRTDGEDNLNVGFATNVNKQLGVGFQFKYIYGRGYYQNQATSLFDYNLWGSYLGDRYQAHALFSIDHTKNTESGGITDDNYITHPESFNDSYTSLEIPTNLNSNWNRNHNVNVFFTHRYNVGFNRKVPMTEEEKQARRFALASKKESEEKNKDKKENEGTKLAGRPDNAKIVGDLPSDSISIETKSDRIAVPDKLTADSLMAESVKENEDTLWLKNEYVPVTSFIHTFDYTTRTRNYIAYSTPVGYFADNFSIPEAKTDSINDESKYFLLKNTLAVALLEGFNKYVKSGLKLYLSHSLRHFELPDTVRKSTTFNENLVYAGAQLEKKLGRLFHYTVKGELGLIGKASSELRLDGKADVNIPFAKDSLRFDLSAFIHRETPAYLLRHFHSSNIWWDNEDFDKQLHSHVEGVMSFSKTKTQLRVAYDNLEKYTYLAQRYEYSDDGNNVGLPIKHQAFARQTSQNISVFTAELYQKLRLGVLCWDNKLTCQISSNTDIIPVPKLNVWSNLYLDFKIAGVLKCHFGADVSYFTEYNAPEFLAPLGQYAVQENENVKTKVGNYPFVDVYANFVLKGCRFFVMMSHVNAGSGSLNYFTTPHYPMNDRIFRLGISWDLFN